MKRGVIGLALALLGSAYQVTAWSQERIYRCGNEYTNSAAMAKQRNCQVVDGGHVTVVHTGGVQGGVAKTSPSEAKSSASSRGVQVDAGQQKTRDNDARAILQAELQKAQDKLQALKQEFNDGNPNKSALELRNPQVFNERLEALKAQIARQETDVAGIQRELSRHTGG
jgi:predicted lipid-binding transport protein (Tim44 family)